MIAFRVCNTLAYEFESLSLDQKKQNKKKKQQTNKKII